MAVIAMWPADVNAMLFSTLARCLRTLKILSVAMAAIGSCFAAFSVRNRVRDEGELERPTRDQLDGMRRFFLLEYIAYGVFFACNIVNLFLVVRVGRSKSLHAIEEFIQFSLVVGTGLLLICVWNVLANISRFDHLSMALFSNTMLFWILNWYVAQRTRQCLLESRDQAASSASSSSSSSLESDTVV